MNPVQDDDRVETFTAKRKPSRWLKSAAVPAPYLAGWSELEAQLQQLAILDNPPVSNSIRQNSRERVGIGDLRPFMSIKQCVFP